MENNKLPKFDTVIAMLSLLDDNDQEVVSQVQNDLVKNGIALVPFLEEIWSQKENEHFQSKIENIIHKIQFDEIKLELAKWTSEGGHDLLHGLILISKYQYPHLNAAEIIGKIEEIRITAWLDLNYSFSPTEKIQILNFVFFKKFGFKGNIKDFTHPLNSFISDVLDTKLGNPILLSSIYMIIANKLEIPIYGVNLPQHFVLAYCNETITESGIEKEVLFYINAFSNGLVFSKDEISKFITLIDVEPKSEFFLPCSNTEIIIRVLNNLIHSFKAIGSVEKIIELEVLKQIVNN